LLDALRGGTDLTVASQILPRRKGILCLRRDHTTKIIGESGLRPGASIGRPALPPKEWMDSS
jgi:hypothetical protein